MNAGCFLAGDVPTSGFVIEKTNGKKSEIHYADCAQCTHIENGRA